MAETVGSVTHAKVITATIISLDKQNEIKEQLEKVLNKSVILEVLEDKSLIGGLKIIVDGLVIDKTIKNDLEELKKYLYSVEGDMNGI
ncbi:MAG: F0F1 ATP synthase subunit delta [Defluviitaleaceae bacterium]|nr:F0F1 ATP synthase subunit delta [Defluviitaleaceae bacterium]